MGFRRMRGSNDLCGSVCYLRPSSLHSCLSTKESTPRYSAERVRCRQRVAEHSRPRRLRAPAADEANDSCNSRLLHRYPGRRRSVPQLRPCKVAKASTEVAETTVSVGRRPFPLLSTEIIAPRLASYLRPPV